MGMLLMGAFTALCLGFLLSGAAAQGQGRCTRGCDLALASYYIWPGSNLTFIGQMMSVPIPRILNYNPQIADPNLILAGSRINVPFSCDCIGGQFLGHVFNFSTFTGVTYTSIAQTYYSNLTTVEAMMMYNTYEASRIPDTGVSLNVTVNCSCGDASVSRDYGLFITYTLRPGDTLESVAAANNLTAEVVRSYNPTLNFSAGAGVAFIPGNQNGTFPTLSRGGGLSPGAIAGISVAVVGGVFFVAGTLFLLMQRRKHAKHIQLQKQEQQLLQTSQGPGRSYSSGPDSSRDGAASGVTGFPLQKSLEFSYKDLANVTNNFSIEYKIGEGGFGAVYYAELHGEKAAIKKMDMQASKEFLAELKVLTHVHHRNLVRLIGYCVEGSLFLVYEYIENGNLSQNLRGSGRRPLSWSERVQIALDSARGLEYIHEHTVPVYVHRDIKPANILIDQNYNGKVADFGLTKLTDIGNSSLPTGLVGTFGYMSPEYAQFGDVSPKVDVYAFGVVLYELISAKEAIVKSHDSVNDSRGLVALFEEALNSPDPSVEMQKLVDPRLGNSYPLDSVQKMAQLAKACTHENPQQRPPMRSIVVTLMSLSSSTDDWDVSAFNGNQGLLNLMSGR